ncbi:MAG: VWA domain-containing protein, partial [Planctomycetes bacterium]|nr:VWA domain-containing protein [Planctomycetota bacterium]
MSWPGFYALSGVWLFLLLIPLIIFYFLKLKRPRKQIPSLALWKQVMNDRRVNSPFQKFKRNLLLLLQLLLLVLLILAAMQPFIQSGSQRAEYLPILIDCSASMAAVDQPGGQNRLDLAKQQVAKLIDDLLPDQRVSLIAVHSTAQRMTDFTDNKRLLRDALDKLSVVDLPSRLEDALRMTQALSRTVPITTVIIYSDGNFPPQIDFELPFELNYQHLPPGGTNIGITGFNARRSQTDNWDVFVRVAGTSGSQLSANVELLQEGRMIGEDSVFIEKGESTRMVFSVETDRSTSLEVRLKPDGFDSLASDNVAFLDLPVGRPLSVFCHLEMVAYRHALKGIQGLNLFPTENNDMGSSEFDILITDRKEDDSLDANVTLFVGIIPDDLKNVLSIQTGLVEVVDWRRSSPLLQHVQLTGVQIADEPVSAKGIQDRHFEELGYEILAHARTGPLILKNRTGKRLSYYLLFHTDRSTLPYRVGFPILVSNIVQIALQQAELSEVRGHPTQTLPPQSLQPHREYRITAPNGTRSNMKSDSNGILSGVPAPLVGRYIVSRDGKHVANTGVSLLNAMETSLNSVEQLQFRELSVSASDVTFQSDQPLWPIFAFAAFFLLLVE